MSDMKRPLVVTDNLVVSFSGSRGGSFRAVDGVSFSVEKGEVLGLVGESGSGKTTLAKAILRLYEPAGGTLLFDGQDISHLGERALRPIRRQMQMVFQDPLSSFNPRIRVGEAVGLALRMQKLSPSSEIQMMVAALLARVGLGPQFAARYPHEMSGGQLQRVAIARALAVEPRLIVADEAVSKLDVSVRAQILNLLRDVQKTTGVALIFITHDLRVARFLCDRIGVMFFGRIVEIGPTEDIFVEPRHPYTKALLSTLVDDSGDGSALEPAAPAGSDGCRYRTRCPIARPKCAVEKPEPILVADGSRKVACPYVLNE